MKFEISSVTTSTAQIYFHHQWVMNSNEWVVQHCHGQKVGLIVANGLPDIWLEQIKSQIVSAGKQLAVFKFDDCESNKSIEQAQQIWHWLAEQYFSRSDTVIGLGGGITTDLAGFVAATYHRGMNYVAIPTTLLAQVDASVGGKTAVNLTHGKNLVGVFNQASAVLIDLHFLSTLSIKQFRCGLAEIIKAAIIADAKLFDTIAQSSTDELLQPALMQEIVFTACRIKADIVERDLLESGLRKVLNLGHTFAHAFELCEGYSGLQHGEAVAIGLLAASRLANLAGMLDQQSLTRISDILQRHSLQMKLQTNTDANEIYTKMLGDKKNQAETIQFVLPTAIGNCKIDCKMDEFQVKQAIDSILDYKS